MTLHRTSSSLRARPLAETLATARALAPTVGITRVTDTTRLDRFGVPVFASIRPGATRGALCVNAGKGMVPDEAEAGAFMESIELAFAERARCAAPLVMMPVAELGRAPDGVEAYLPKRPLAPTDRILAAEAEDIATGEREWVPAERVIFPILPEDGGGTFGSDGNGICSGNTIAEATVHGLAEVIERDVTSFIISIADDTVRIATDTLPPHLRALAERTAARHGELVVRHAPNAFGLPYFLAAVIDTQLTVAHRGDGLHPSASIAATRAVCEAFQSRLTDIHGGRDDLTFHRVQRDAADSIERAQQRFIAALRSGAAVPYQTVVDRAAEATDLDTATQLLLDAMRARGLPRALRVALGPADLPISVQRVIVPHAECRAGLIQRIGPRLRAELERRRTQAQR